MDISLNGTLYVYFIRSVFEGNKKIGIEFIIDPKRSNNQLIDGLNRLNYLNGNKFVIYKDNYSNIDLKDYLNDFISLKILLLCSGIEQRQDLQEKRYLLLDSVIDKYIKNDSLVENLFGVKSN